MLPLRVSLDDWQGSALSLSSLFAAQEELFRKRSRKGSTDLLVLLLMMLMMQHQRFMWEVYLWEHTWGCIHDKTRQALTDTVLLTKRIRMRKYKTCFSRQGHTLFNCFFLETSSDTHQEQVLMMILVGCVRGCVRLCVGGWWCWRETDDRLDGALSRPSNRSTAKKVYPVDGSLSHIYKDRKQMLFVCQSV